MPTKAERRLIRQWEESLINDYRRYRSHQLLDPLYEKFEKWKSGKMESDELFNAIHHTHKENQHRFNFFAQKRPDLVRWIQFDPWFDEWLEEHPSPEGADLVPDSLKSEHWEEMESGEVPEDTDES